MLLLDGLPFGGRLEVIALALLAVLIFSRPMRTILQSLLQVGNRRSGFILILTILILLKFFTFLRFPIGNNFEVCIKSTYRPVEATCEKSFDYLFYSNDGVNGKGDITRVDSHIDFRTTTGDPTSTLGASRSTWNLPFQNEFPRFAELWMDRIPFSARVGAIVSANDASILPIEFVGSIVVRVAGKTYQASSYETRKLLLVPLVSGRQELIVDFTFSDESSLTVPDEAPAIRGPYAHLVIAQPVNASESNAFRLSVRGYAVDLTGGHAVKSVVLRSSSQRYPSAKEIRADVAQHFGNAGFKESGFRADVELRGVIQDAKPFDVVAQMNDGTERVIGRVTPPNWHSSRLVPSVTLKQDSGVISDFEAWFTLPNGSELLSAENRIRQSLLSDLILLLIDGIQLGLFFVGLTSLVIRRLCGRVRASLEVSALALGVVTSVWLVDRLGRSTNLAVIPWTFVMAVVVVAPLIWFRFSGRYLSSIYIIVASGLCSLPLTLRLFRQFTGLGNSEWWGFMVFRDRQSDWFVFQGYAYQILTQQSLRAGEGIFYFMPGSRYVIFLTHIFFGNNDVLIGILVFACLLGCGLHLIDQLLDFDGSSRIQYLLAGVCGLIVLGSLFVPLTQQLSISSSSEVFAWIVYLSASALLVRVSSSSFSTRSVLVLGFLLGLVVFLRPNYLMISVCYLVAAAFVCWKNEIDRRTSKSLVLSGWLTIGFFASFLLPLMHNVYFGETVNFFTSRADPSQTVFEPVKLMNFFSDPMVRLETLSKFQRFLYWQMPAWDTYLIASWLSQAVYVVVIAYVWRIRRSLFITNSLLLAPIAYIVSSVPFGIMTIPERQFLMSTLAIVVSALIAAKVVYQSERPKTDDAAVVGRERLDSIDRANALNQSN
jgi:hypothetical protein